MSDKWFLIFFGAMATMSLTLTGVVVWAIIRVVSSLT